jgi:hypothetical protein
VPVEWHSHQLGRSLNEPPRERKVRPPRGTTTWTPSERNGYSVLHIVGNREMLLIDSAKTGTTQNELTNRWQAKPGRPLQKCHLPHVIAGGGVECSSVPRKFCSPLERTNTWSGCTGSFGVVVELKYDSIGLVQRSHESSAVLERSSS